MKNLSFKGKNICKVAIILFILLLQPYLITSSQGQTNHLLVTIQSNNNISYNSPLRQYSYWISYLEELGLKNILTINSANPSFNTYLYNLKFIFCSGLYTSSLFAPYISSFTTEILKYFSLYNSSGISFAESSDPYNNGKSFSFSISDVLYTLNTSRSVIHDPTLDQQINNTISALLNDLFIKSDNNSISYTIFQPNNKTNELSSHDLFNAIQWINEVPYSDNLTQDLSKRIDYIIVNPINYNSWTYKAYDSLLLFKTGNFLHNETWIQQGASIASNILQNHGYTNDSDTLGAKSYIIEYFIPYYPSIVIDYADFLISLMFNYTWGLQPLLTSNEYYNLALSKRVTFSFFYLTPWVEILKFLDTNYRTQYYYNVLKQNTYFLFSTLLYSKTTNEYKSLDTLYGYIDNDTLFNTPSVRVTLTPNFELILASMFASLQRNGSIDDLTAPNINISYWNFKYNLFNSSQLSSPLAMNKMNEIASLNNSNLILLRIVSEDKETGLGDFNCSKNNITIQSFPKTVTKNMTYYDSHPGPTAVRKFTGNETIVIPINGSLQTEVNYSISVADKVGNIANISITIKKVPNESFTVNSRSNPSTDEVLNLLGLIVIFTIIVIVVVAVMSINSNEKNKKEDSKKKDLKSTSTNKTNQERKITNINLILSQIENIEADLKDKKDDPNK